MDRSADELGSRRRHPTARPVGSGRARPPGCPDTHIRRSCPATEFVVGLDHYSEHGVYTEVGRLVHDAKYEHDVSSADRLCEYLGYWIAVLVELERPEVRSVRQVVAIPGRRGVSEFGRLGSLLGRTAASVLGVPLVDALEERRVRGSLKDVDPTHRAKVMAGRFEVVQAVAGGLLLVDDVPAVPHRRRRLRPVDRGWDRRRGVPRCVGRGGPGRDRRRCACRRGRGPRGDGCCARRRPALHEGRDRRRRHRRRGPERGPRPHQEGDPGVGPRRSPDARESLWAERPLHGRQRDGSEQDHLRPRRCDPRGRQRRRQGRHLAGRDRGAAAWLRPGGGVDRGWGGPGKRGPLERGAAAVGDLGLLSPSDASSADQTLAAPPEQLELGIGLRQPAAAPRGLPHAAEA